MAAEVQHTELVEVCGSGQNRALAEIDPLGTFIMLFASNFLSGVLLVKKTPTDDLLFLRDKKYLESLSD
jgi:hypothetical protein